MNIQKNINLAPFTTFGINSVAKFFVECFNEQEIKEVLNFAKQNNLNILFLGGGSNILFTKDFDGLVIKISLKGIQKIDNYNSDNHIKIEVCAGENWHNFVLLCIENNFGGLENLSLIPGNIGTAPMQNIGAYGVELKDIFHSLKAINLKTLETETFNLEDCKFGYRESFFKNEGKNKYLITKVNFILTKKNHKLNILYGDIKTILNDKGIVFPTIKDISDVVIEIRKSKLPDPKILGNAGSFFKNPTITKEHFLFLKEKFTDFKGYENDLSVKIPAAYLIEKIGFKGYKTQTCGVHEKQALVIVNFGNATGKQIFELSEIIINQVKKEFDIILEREVNII